MARTRPGQEIASVSDVRPLGCPVALTADPMRSIIALFLADFLSAVLKESASDALLWQYLYSQAQDLAAVAPRALPNFHLSFVYRLTQFLGIAPDLSHADYAIFDLREARYIHSRPLHNQFVEGAASKIPLILSRLTNRSLHLLRVTRDERNAILDALLQYYSLHYAPLPSIPSLSVLRDLTR